MTNYHSLDKQCSVCGTRKTVEIETVTNVIPQPEEMFPVFLCAKHKRALQEKLLDITLNKTGKLCFTLKKNVT
ncbi:MAG: hypothetical protein AUJ72_05425 [Candidatus Omnitrophica bacterium CG1_02_46_14]|nr:MAG: hypothetical protein AUJ72_05425 [Candidatus Omnitrophica bacterium CG1_02_46_14]